MALSGPGEQVREEIEAQQLEKLRVLLRTVAGSNSFYKPKFEASGLGADVANLDEYFRRMPFTHKRELIDDQQAHPPFGTNLTYPIERYTRFCQTSATSGKPMRWLDTPLSWDKMLKSWGRVFEAASVGVGDRIFFAFSFGPFLGFWTAFDAAAQLGCLCIPGGGMRSAARLQVIIATKATVLCCTPTYAIHLAEAAAEEGIDLTASHVRSIIVAGEPGGSIMGTRNRIEKLWPGSRVMDHHGMSETGPVSYGCPRRPGVLHVIESAFIAEVINAESGEAVAEGETGELVLTNLGRLGSPLLRYRTGDIVQMGARGGCECGSEDLTLPGGILGRTDDMLVVRGVNVYPGAVEDILHCAGGVAEYRVQISEHRALVELQIEVEPEPEYASDAGLPHRLEAALRDALALRIPVTLVPGGSLPRFEMKARRWVRM